MQKTLGGHLGHLKGALKNTSNKRLYFGSKFVNSKNFHKEKTTFTNREWQCIEQPTLLK